MFGMGFVKQIKLAMQSAIPPNGVTAPPKVVERGTFTGSTKGLTPAEKNAIEKLLSQGRNVEIIPRSNVQGVSSPDFLVNGVPTELKTISGSSPNTPVTRITDGFAQNAERVILDARNTWMTIEDANATISRVKGIFNNNIPGSIEIWTSEGTVIFGGQ